MIKKIFSVVLRSIIKRDIYLLLEPLKITFENLWFIIKLQKYPTLEEEQWLRLNSGNRLYCHIHRPVENKRWPGIVLVPGSLSDGSVFDKWICLNLRANDIASQGYVVIHFDPEGRGKSDGREDYGGSVHQDSLLHILKYLSSLPYVDSNNIGVVSFSYGITMSASALASHSHNPEVSYLFDWEGPSNKYEITMNNSIDFFKAYSITNDDFWSSRQACNFISEIRCGYFRYQCQRDHIQGSYKQHAIDLINIALKGKAKWVRCNDTKITGVIDEKGLKRNFWVSPWSNQKKKMMQYINQLFNIKNK